MPDLAEYKRISSVWRGIINFLGKRTVTIFTCTITGAIFGYIVLHPFTMIANDLFYGSGAHDSHSYLNIAAIIKTFKLAYTSSHLTHAFSYIILCSVIGYFYGRKIVAHRTLEDQLTRFAEIGRNAATIIHDLNNPLSGVIGYADLLMADLTEEKQKKYCLNISKSAKRVARMITEIKQIARGGQILQLDRTSTDIGMLIQSTLERMQFGSEVINNATEGYRAEVDPLHFERVIWNVLKNAEEAAGGKSGAKIEINMNESKDTIEIEIRNSGSPIPKKVMKSLFEFGHTFGKNEGMGIGLHNCATIIRAHGGSIRITSTNNGTSVYISVPKIAETAPTHSTSSFY